MQHTFLVGELDVDHDEFTAVAVEHLGPPRIAVPILARIWLATFDRDTTAMLTTLQAHAWSHLTAAPQPTPPRVTFNVVVNSSRVTAPTRR